MNELLELLDSVLGIHKNHPKGEFYYYCPFCNHPKPKLAVNLDKRGVWHCWHCNDRGSIVNLFHKLNCTREELNLLYKLLGEDRPPSATETPATLPLSLPSEYRPMWELPVSLDFSYKSALKYVRDRNITAADILRYQIGYCADGPYGGRIIIPSYDEAGKLNYFTARSFYSNEGLKYKNPPVSKNVVMFEFHVNWKYQITLVEGAYDAIAIKRNAIPLLGKTIPNKLAEQIEQKGVSDICLVLDNDALHATSEISKRFIQNGKTVRVVKMEQKDPSETGFSKMSELIKAAVPLTFADLIKMRVTA